MSLPANNGVSLGSASRRFARRLLATGGNRLELLMVEVQVERRHLLHVVFIALAAAGCGLLASGLLTIAVVAMFWGTHPIGALLVLACLYSIGALLLYRRLVGLQSNWRFLPETLEQIQKDRTCLEKILT